jgi:hypothetical protein
MAAAAAMTAVVSLTGDGMGEKSFRPEIMLWGESQCQRFVEVCDNVPSKERVMARYTRPSRRSFVSLLSLFGGLTALSESRVEAAAQAAASSAQGFDLRWIDELKGQHKMVFDMLDADPLAEPPGLRLPRNYMDTFRDVYHVEYPEVRTIVGIAGRAFAINASDRLWQKYALGERGKIMDPATKQPAVRNIFMDDPTLGVKALQARGTIFWQCNIALNGIAQQLASARNLPIADVRADLAAGLNPGVRIVPSHVMALGLVQEHGANYVKI